jgi:hypothetical protein
LERYVKSFVGHGFSHASVPRKAEALPYISIIALNPFFMKLLTVSVEKLIHF